MFCVRQGGVGFNDHAVERTLAVEYVLRCISSPLLTFDLGAKLDVETVRAFLEFLYTDEIIDMPNAAVKQLLALARQYNLPRLIAICRGSNFTATLADDLWSMSSPSSPSVFIVVVIHFFLAQNIALPLKLTPRLIPLMGSSKLTKLFLLLECTLH